jgi:hypothetical protein
VALITRIFEVVLTVKKIDRQQAEAKGNRPAFYIWPLLLLLSCASVQAAGQDIQGVSLTFVESQNGQGAITTTMFANKDFLHIRDDINPEDFILLDRKKQQIQIVTRSEKTVFVISAKPITQSSPMALGFKEAKIEDTVLPEIEDRAVTHYRYTTNGQLCYEAAVLPPDFLREAAQAMYEFKKIMAGEHATTLDSIPADMINACDLAQNVFHAGAHLQHGVPVRVWTPQGYQRFLKGYELQSSLPISALLPPLEFERFSVGDILNDGK